MCTPGFELHSTAVTKLVSLPSQAMNSKRTQYCLSSVLEAKPWKEEPETVQQRVRTLHRLNATLLAQSVCSVPVLRNSNLTCQGSDQHDLIVPALSRRSK